jgi:hypothetical protein
LFSFFLYFKMGNKALIKRAKADMSQKHTSCHPFYLAYIPIRLNVSIVSYNNKFHIKI